MKYGILIVLVAAALAGCLSVETEIDLDRDGSGRLDLVYEIDADLYKLGVFDDSDVALPIPVSRREFRESARRIDGLSLRRYRIREDESAVVVTASLRFDSVATLNEYFGTPDAVTITTAGGTTTWRQLVSPGAGSQGPNAEALSDSLDGYNLRYRLHAPAEISEVNGGTLLPDGRTAEITLSLADVATMQEPTFWEVRW